MNKILDEYVKNCSSCIEKMGENEEWKRMKEELKNVVLKSDDEGLKKMRLISDDELEVMKEELKRSEDELNGMDMNEVVNELEKVNRKIIVGDKKIYVFSDGRRKEISTELLKKYPESLLSMNMLDIDSRNEDNEVEIDFKLKYVDEMIRYMKSEIDIGELNGVEFEDFCEGLMTIRIPFRRDIMDKLYNGSNEYGIGWKNRCVIVNGKEYNRILRYLKKEWKLSELRYNAETGRIECVIEDKYESVIQCFSNYLEDKSKVDEVHSAIDRKLLNCFIDEYSVDMNNEDVKEFFYPIYSPFLKESIINEEQYEFYLKEWLGDDYKWKLLYRTSEHGYTAESFHKYCDKRGPTLILIKSSLGWIFGGYTTQSWSGWRISDNMIY